MSGVPARGLAKVERPELISKEVSRRLLDYLLSGEVGVGERIPSERQLSASLGVGRSAIRDAVKPLQLMGLLEVRVGDGTYLNGADPNLGNHLNKADWALLPRVIEWGLRLEATRTLELAEARGYIEVAVVALAAERRTASAVERLEEHIGRMAMAKSEAAFVDAYEAFHFEIAEAANNTVLSGILMSVHALRIAGIQRVVREMDEIKRVHAEHAVIFECIKAGDRAAAEAAMSAHVHRVTALLRATLDKQTANQRASAARSNVDRPRHAPSRSR